ncbi:MAG: response regulator, partial [Thermoanaerobaculia bacterium]
MSRATLARRSAPPRVLVVDDSPAVLFVLKRTFEQMGFAVETADSCEAGLAILPRTAFAAVITDLRLGGDERTRGLEILSMSRQAQPRARVIVLTGFGNPTVMDRAFQMGADFYFEKPVSLE